LNHFSFFGKKKIKPNTLSFLFFFCKMPPEVIYHTKQEQRIGIGLINKLLTPYRRPTGADRREEKRRNGTLHISDDFSMVSRPDEPSGLFAGLFAFPTDKHDSIFKSIMEVSMDRNVSFTFSEQLARDFGPLVIDLDGFFDPSARGIMTLPEIHRELQTMADSEGWSNAKQVMEKKVREADRSKCARIFHTKCMEVFMDALGDVLAVFANRKHLEQPQTMDYSIRQRRDPKFSSFDSGSKPFYADGAHILVNVNCTSKDRVAIRHRFLESPKFQYWFQEYVLPYLYRPAYTCQASGSASANSYFDESYAITKLYDYGVTSGCSAFSVLGTHKTGYYPYVLTQFGTFRFELQELSPSEQEKLESYTDIPVICSQSILYDYGTDELSEYDWSRELFRVLPKPLRGEKSLRDFIYNNSFLFSVRSNTKRAYVKKFFGSQSYIEMMEEFFPVNYELKGSFYVTLPGNMFVNRKGSDEWVLEEGEEAEGEMEAEEEFPREEDTSEDSEDENYNAAKAKDKKKRRSKFLQEEEEEDGDGRPSTKKNKQTGGKAVTTKKASVLSKKKQREKQVDQEIEESVKAAREGRDNRNGMLDYRRFQDVERMSVVMITEEQLMQVQSMEELEELYRAFTASLNAENTMSSGMNDDLKQAYMYAMSLPEDYYCTGTRENRIRVCWALHNISEYLLVVWIRFVYRRPDKDFTRMAEWLEEWNSCRLEEQGNSQNRGPGKGQGLQLGSLRHWLMTTNPSKLNEITSNIFSSKVEKMIDEVTISVMMANQLLGNQSRAKNVCIGDFQMAQLAEFLVGDRIVLCSLPNASNVVWMKYDPSSGLWKRHATGLSIELSISLTHYFRQYSMKLSQQIQQLQHSGKTAAEIKRETEFLTRKMQEVLNVNSRLSNHQGKCMIINEAKNLLYREGFLSQLDSNKFLFAFQNGVLDFSVSPPLFRKSEPSDLLTVNCGNSWFEKFDGTSRTMTPTELEETHNRLAALHEVLGEERVEKFPGLYARFATMEEKVEAAGDDALKEDPSWFFHTLPDRFKPIGMEIKKYMEEMFPDPKTRSYAYKLTCLPLVGCTLKNQFAHFFTGKGKNGKSVFTIDLFKKLYGGYYYCLDIRYWIQNPGQAGSCQPELVQAKRARWIPSLEPPKFATLKESMMKLLIGGTDEINCRNLYEPPIQYTSQATCALISNHNLALESYDGGSTRRLRSIPCISYFYDPETGPLLTNSGKPMKGQFPKDTNLTSKMDRWPEVYLWMAVLLYTLIDGALPGLKDVPEIEFHTNNFFNDFDVEGTFIRSFIEVDNSSLILKTDLNKQYKEWHLNQFAKEPSNMKSLHSRVSEHCENKKEQVFEDGWRGLSFVAKGM
jgi:hypothetical protein